MLGGGGGHLVCVIMTHCVRKSICDLTLRPQYYNTKISQYYSIELPNVIKIEVQHLFSKVDARRCLVKKILKKISQNLYFG